jgi:hypothetical protein
MEEANNELKATVEIKKILRFVDGIMTANEKMDK